MFYMHVHAENFGQILSWKLHCVIVKNNDPNLFNSNLFMCIYNYDNGVLPSMPKVCRSSKPSISTDFPLM